MPPRAPYSTVFPPVVVSLGLTLTHTEQAFPCLGTHNASYPTVNAVKVALLAVREWLDEVENRSKVQPCE